MPLPISQIEYVTYTRYLNEIKIVEQCDRKEELSRIGFIEGRFVKLSVIGSLDSYKTIFEKLSPFELTKLQNKINFIKFQF